MVGGDYYLSARGGQKISGHFFQVLKRDTGTWKIAAQVFARPEPVTAVEGNEYHTGG
jgi:hypothetical protein